ncbi:GNAT family N-acetyltransferase [Calycomorphotria hydatis]|uniref:GNAT family N-acetyltransferase n=1 Tax=Calycomorphotria hydatis TaxID=2528027 RepID=UPI0011A3A05A|nr:GNAT family N-acetyltransferase [Calycomorphotria hydatis]
MEITTKVASSEVELEQVVLLWKPNRTTLGFFPDGAFKESYAEGKILVAIANDLVVGYIIYGTSRQPRRVRLTHLCVGSEFRGRGIARMLIDKLRELSSSYSYIRLSCRRDNPAWALWPKLGFVARGHLVGRGKDCHMLTDYRMETKERNLFSTIEDSDDRIKAAIDTNIFYDIYDPDRNQAEETQGILSDWIEPLLQLCVTGELHNELSRIDDPVHREEMLAFAQQFDQLGGDSGEFLQVYDSVRSIMGGAILKAMPQTNGIWREPLLQTLRCLSLATKEYLG